MREHVGRETIQGLFKRTDCPSFCTGIPKVDPLSEWFKSCLSPWHHLIPGTNAQRCSPVQSSPSQRAPAPRFSREAVPLMSCSLRGYCGSLDDLPTYTVGKLTDSSSTSTCSASALCNLRSAISTVISDGSGIVVMEPGTHVINQGDMTVSVGAMLHPDSHCPIAFNLPL
jgi:hypothetical protein